VKLTLIRHTESPDLTIALAARRCYSSKPSTEIEESLSAEKVEKLIMKLRERNHLSPFEHAVFTFAADGLSRSLSHQLVRHRIASYSQESQRYVDYSKPGFVPPIIPPTVKADSKAYEIFSEAVKSAVNTYNLLVKEGIPPEDARYVLPNAIETKIVFTMNARSLFNFFEQRCCMKAQWEIRHLAALMLKECKQAAPLAFKFAGAPCLSASHPYCRENDPSCPNYRFVEKNK